MLDLQNDHCWQLLRLRGAPCYLYADFVVQALLWAMAACTGDARLQICSGGSKHIHIWPCRFKRWMGFTYLKAWKGSLLSQLGASSSMCHLSLVRIWVLDRHSFSGFLGLLYYRVGQVCWAGHVSGIVGSHHLNDLGGEWQHPVALADSAMEQHLPHLQ